MQIDIIEKFYIKGRGVVFTCHLPELDPLTHEERNKKLSELINEHIFEYKSEYWQIRDIEMSRGGIVDIANRKRFYSLKVSPVLVAQIDRASLS